MIKHSVYIFDFGNVHQRSPSVLVARYFKTYRKDVYAAANYRRGSDIAAAIVWLIGVEFRVELHMFTLADARYRVLAPWSSFVSGTSLPITGVVRNLFCMTSTT